MYLECFTGIGKFKDFEYHINVDKNVKPVVHAPRRIALSLQGKLEKELEEMVRQGIIAPVEGHSDWVNSLVIREKPNGSLRICFDPKDPNKVLGMVNYLSSYIHHMSDLTSNLRNLLKKDSLFQWTETHEAEFQMLKKAISKDVNLQYFDPKKPVVLQVDASQVGLGAALLQDSKVIAYASKSLTPAETRYANIEREMLAVVFGCLKFHHYLYGRSFVCNSDHQPLEKIHLKHLSDAPPRLQRLLLKLQPYDITIKYLPGHKVAVADALSRVSPSGKTVIRGLDVTIHEMTNQPYVHNRIAQIQKATREDQVLQLLMQQIMEGWPQHCKSLPVVLRPFWQLKDDLAIELSCVTYQGRFYIPSSMCKACLNLLHEGHPGIVKMKLRAQTSVYWIGLNKEIEDHILGCEPCQINSRSQSKEPVIPVEIPNRPWQKLGADLFFQGGKSYLLICDYYSKFPVVHGLPATSSKDVISALSSSFSVFGIPEEIISDNGSQFSAKEYHDFATRYGFRITTSSPHYPRGHGFIEHQVQTIKHIFAKCAEDGSDPNLALLQLRATPLDCRTPSPGELLQNRQLRTTLPAIIRPPPNSEAVRASLQSRQDFSKYDAHTKELPRLLPKQLVRLQDPSTKKWSIPGEVLQKAETPNSYVVKTPKGVLRRNWIHIKEAAMPGPQVTTKQAPAMQHQWPPGQLISKITQLAKTIEKPRAAAMSPSEPQPALPTPVPPSPQRIQSVPKPHPVTQENDRPHNPTRVW